MYCSVTTSTYLVFLFFSNICGLFFFLAPTKALYTRRGNSDTIKEQVSLVTVARLKNGQPWWCVSAFLCPFLILSRELLLLSSYGATWGRINFTLLYVTLVRNARTKVSLHNRPGTRLCRQDDRSLSSDRNGDSQQTTVFTSSTLQL